MILFRQVYKSANDDIVPDSQLLDKILAGEPKKKKAFYPNVLKYGSIAAACLIFAGTMVIYPNLSKDLNDTNEKTTPVIDATASVTKNKHTKDAVSEKRMQPDYAIDETTSANMQIPEIASDFSDEPEYLADAAEERTKEKTAPEVTSSPSPTKTEVSEPERNHEKPKDAQAVNPTEQPLAPKNSVKPNATEAPEVETAKSEISEANSVPPEAEESQENTFKVSAKSVHKPANEQVAEDGNVQNEQITAPSAVNPAEDEFSTTENYAPEPKNAKVSSGGSSGGGGGSASGGGSSAASVTKPAISPNKALEIANDAFLADFGEEFLNSSEVDIEFNGAYVITRYDDKVTYTVLISRDGKLTKLY